MHRLITPGTTVILLLILLLLLLNERERNNQLKNEKETLLLKSDSLHIVTLKLKKEKKQTEQRLDSLLRVRNRNAAP
jgi:FtsZ-binding cell division protein ZapB